MSDRDRVARAICRADNRWEAEPDKAVIDTYEDDAEYYLAMADAAIEEMEQIELDATLPPQVVEAMNNSPVANIDTTGTPPAVTTVYSTKRGTRLPEDWQPSDKVQTELVQQYPHLNFPLLLDEFRDYWCAVPGQRGLKLSWDRTFRNSVRERAHKPQYRRRGIGMRAGDQPMSKVDLKAMSYLDD